MTTTVKKLDRVTLRGKPGTVVKVTGAMATVLMDEKFCGRKEYFNEPTSSLIKATDESADTFPKPIKTCAAYKAAIETNPAAIAVMAQAGDREVVVQGAYKTWRFASGAVRAIEIDGKEIWSRTVENEAHGILSEDGREIVTPTHITTTDKGTRYNLSWSGAPANLWLLHTKRLSMGESHPGTCREFKSLAAVVNVCKAFGNKNDIQDLLLPI